MPITANNTTLVFNDSTTQTTAGASGVPVLTAYTSPGTWTKPATIKAIKVTVVGGGGKGGDSIGGGGSGGYSMFTSAGGGGAGGAAEKVYPAPSLPGPQPYTVGGAGATSSFGVAPVTVISATGGSAGPNLTAPGSTPAIAVFGPGGAGGTGSNGDLNTKGGGGATGVASPSTVVGGSGGSSIFGSGGQAQTAAGSYGGGGGGAARAAVSPSPGTASGGAGGAGVVIVEEFY